MVIKVSSLIEKLKDPRTFCVSKGIHPRIHSRDLDRLIGYKIPKIEQSLLQKYRAYDKAPDESNKKKHFEGTETWIGLHPQILQTPYSEIYEFLSLFKKFKPKKVVDLGAGYGRVAIVLNALFPEAEFIGHEILKDRLDEARRIFTKLEMKNATMLIENILEDSFELPEADIYFIYDFSGPLDLKIILERLSSKMDKDKFFIVAKGDGIRSIIQLKFPEIWALNGTIHQKTYSIYSSFVELNNESGVFFTK